MYEFHLPDMTCGHCAWLLVVSGVCTVVPSTTSIRRPWQPGREGACAQIRSANRHHTFCNQASGRRARAWQKALVFGLSHRRPCRRDDDAAFSRCAAAKAIGQIGPGGQGAHRGARQGKARAGVHQNINLPDPAWRIQGRNGCGLAPIDPNGDHA